MLQNPSKYHPNPLSHFLALHNSATSHHQHHSQQQHVQHQLSGSPLDGGVTTPLDVGKSFTIAAILGLQKTAIENNQKDFNSVMNLSLNAHHQKNNCVTSNGSGLSVNNFDCDTVNSSVVNRYLPTSSVPNVNPAHLRINHFGHHVAVTGAANAVAPSALQSLQQLHQHHAQQANLGFQQRDKIKSDHISAKKSSLKSKRVRTIFTPEQLERLEAEFERQQYMVGPERLYLAHTLQLTEAQVKVWFQNRRIKWRKHHLELTQQRLALIRQNQVPSTDGNLTSPPRMNAINPKFHQSESDLSICNDSMDTESVNDADDV